MHTYPTQWRGFVAALTGLVLLGGLFVPFIPASAATTPAPKIEDRSGGRYRAKFVPNSNSELTVLPGQTFVYKVGFQNTGKATWKKTDKNFLSIYTYEPKYRQSVFYDPSWDGKTRPVIYDGKDVPPGYTGHFTFTLKAPKREGTYTEGFNLAAENVTWVLGGQFRIKIHVKKSAAAAPAPAPAPEPVVPEKTEVQTSVPEYQATVLLRSAHEMTARPGDEVSFKVGVQNSGSQPWRGYGIRSSMIRIATVQLADVRLPSWPEADLAVMEPEKEVPPGGMAFINFAFRAPAELGTHNLVFQLIGGSVGIPGGTFEIPVTVTDDAGLPTPISGDGYVAPPTVIYDPEPQLRVGLFKTEKEEVITADHAFSVQDTSGQTLLSVPLGESAGISYVSGVYRAKSAGTAVASTLPLRLVPDEPSIFTITTFEQRPLWNPKLNDNMYRGILEIRYSEANKTVWIINEVPMDQYLKGLTEAGESSNAEYQKALHTAARSYAYYHYSKKYKHKDRYFDVDATYDQVYKGYGAEKRQPRIGAAVDATRGMVVQYQGGLAVTPFYSRSDGRTRSWSEVWGGSVPYLISVPTPYDVGQTLWGHGVGMAATDAVQHAMNEGWTWEQILKYYYTGVDVVRKWE